MLEGIRQRAKESHDRAKKIMGVKQKGQAIGIGNQFLGLALGAILLVISVVIFSNVAVIMPTTLGNVNVSVAANNTLNNIFSTTYSAFNLSTVALIVVAAAIIIAAAFLLVAGGRR